MTTLFNANPRSAYRAGFYRGTHTVGELRQHGDFGLGATDGNDGELVLLDGRAFRSAADGTTHELPDDATTPYATVVPFEPTVQVDVSTADKPTFEQQIARQLALTNRIWALRIHGRFDVVEAGAGERQHEPFRPMSQVMAEYRWIRHRDTTGTLVAFACPDLLLGIDFVGFHYHWLSDDLSQGGHVVDFTVRQAHVEACEATRFTVDIAADERLHSLDLTPTN